MLQPGDIIFAEFGYGGKNFVMVRGIEKAPKYEGSVQCYVLNVFDFVDATFYSYWINDMFLLTTRPLNRANEEK
jgi:hypothetical protein